MFADRPGPRRRDRSAWNRTRRRASTGMWPSPTSLPLDEQGGACARGIRTKVLPDVKHPLHGHRIPPRSTRLVAFRIEPPCHFRVGEPGLPKLACPADRRLLPRLAHEALSPSPVPERGSTAKPLSILPLLVETGPRPFRLGMVPPPQTGGTSGGPGSVRSIRFVGLLLHRGEGASHTGPERVPWGIRGGSWSRRDAAGGPIQPARTHGALGRRPLTAARSRRRAVRPGLWPRHPRGSLIRGLVPRLPES